MGVNYSILRGTAREKLGVIRPQSIQTVVTSPPYWGLRDYKVEPEVWEHPGDSYCDITGHDWGPWQGYTGHRAGMGKWNDEETIKRGQPSPEDGENQRFCQSCGAWEGPLGLEPTPEMFIDHLGQCFDAVWRVLKDDGTLWIVIGDTYARARGRSGSPKLGEGSLDTTPGKYAAGLVPQGAGGLSGDLKSGDLVGIPWMLAFALRARGWYLRQEVIWHKPNGMPESVRSRTTRIHEQIFMLTKRERYYHDHEAIKEPAVSSHASGNGFKRDHRLSLGGRGNEEQWTPTQMRNKRSVWSVNTRQFKEAHFAVFPHKLITPCILAGSKAGDLVCDPFMGTGTVGEVCAEHGRRFVGVELSPVFANMAQERLDAAYNVGSMVGT